MVHDLDDIDDLHSFFDLEDFNYLDNIRLRQPQGNLPPHPPSYQDSSGLPAYQDTFQVTEYYNSDDSMQGIYKYPMTIPGEPL